MMKFFQYIFVILLCLVCYTKNQAEARAMIDKLVTQGDKLSMLVKARALTGYTERLGYEKNLAESKALIESLIAQGDTQAILWKVEGLAAGLHGFEKNSEEAKAFIDDLVEKKNKYAMKLKVVGLVHGEYGYAKDPETSYALTRKELITNLDVSKEVRTRQWPTSYTQ